MAGGSYPQPNHLRHPELVSGPICRFARSKRRQTQTHRQIRPMRIGRVDKVDLPLAMPTLELFLTENCRFHFAKQLIVHESVNGVFRSESGDRIVSVLPKSCDEIGCHADVDRAVGLACEDVDAREAFVVHKPEFAARWVLKQVQDDDICEVDL